MSIEIDDIVQDHEKRITGLEVSGARLDERLDALVKSTNNLKWGMFCFSFLMLLALIYSAIGPNGYKQVTSTVAPIIQQTK